MSDFEQWYESEFDSGLHYDATFKAWQAAKQSMQGEAVAEVTSIEIYGRGCMQATIEAAFLGVNSIDKGDKLYTHAPDSAARIAEQDARIKELEQQLEVARKDAERYQWLRNGGKDLGGEVIIYGYSPKGLDESIDAAIRQIGGAE